MPLIVMLVDQGRQSELGLHAVAVTGFSLGKPAAAPYDSSEFRLKASRIDEFYAHDDGVGPFARMRLKDFNALKEFSDGNTRLTPVPALTTSWIDSDGKVGKIFAVPNYILLPLYHKIRIPFRTAMNVIKAFDEFVKLDEIKKPCPHIADLEWDIYLTDVNAVKTEIAECDLLADSYRVSVLTQLMPKYIWRATATHNATKVLDLLLDATDIEQGPLMVRAIEYDQNIGHTLRECTKDTNNVQPYELYPVRAILKWFADQPVQ